MELLMPIFSGLEGKRVLVTGASGGIGRSMSHLFAKSGATLGIHYNENRDDAESLAFDINNSAGGEAICFQADLLSSDMASLVDNFVDRAGGIDILINNAGAIFGFTEFLELDEASWRDTQKLNLEAPFFLAQKAFIHMKKEGGGKIINIGSIAAKYGGSSRSLHYGAAKAALESVTIGLARAGAQHNILVNMVRGGFIDTPFHKKLSSSKNIEERINLIPLKRAGKPEDVARMVLYLASESGDFITGEILTVAGGD